VHHVGFIVRILCVWLAQHVRIFYQKNTYACNAKEEEF